MSRKAIIRQPQKRYNIHNSAIVEHKYHIRIRFMKWKIETSSKMDAQF